MFSWPRMGSALLVSCCLAVAPAQAAFPGANGKVAFERFDRTATCELYEIWLANADGTGRTRLTCGGRPAWSPDGNQLAFAYDVGSPIRRQIFVINADGSGRRQVTLGDTNASDPAWTPDGRIGYSSFTAGGQSAIYTIRPNGTDRRLLLSEPDLSVELTEPKWSPDGTLVVFTSIRRVQSRDVGPALEIHTVKTDGTDRRRLTMTEPKPFGAAGNASNPEWAPDGRRIAFTASGGYEVRTMDPSGGSIASLGRGEMPAWSPDGTKIVFLDQIPDALFVVRPDGSDRRQFSETYGNEAPYDAHPDWQPLAANVGNRPPDCSRIKATPDRLWPPNHKLRLVTLTGAADPDGGPVTLTITGVQQDEPLGDKGKSKGKGKNDPDAVRTSVPHQVWLRAERSGGGDGRVYRVSFTATDGRGGSCAGSASVGVPRGRGAAVDSGAVYNSFG